jgi:hypothetical protein
VTWTSCHTDDGLHYLDYRPIADPSERRGRASPVFAMALYQHVIPSMQAEAARAFAALIDLDD